MKTNLEYCQMICGDLEAAYNGVLQNEEGETITLYDYFSDVLDFEYTISSSKEYKSVKVWITLGGPNVWIDTSDSYVRLAWGSNRGEWPLAYEVCEAIDSIFEEYYNC
jgi:hypothetical protein